MFWEDDDICGSGLYFDGSESLYLPLWYPSLGGNPATFKSMDRNAHICTLTGATWGSQGRTFDGLDNNIAVADNAILNPTQAISVEVWFNPTSSTIYNFIVYKCSDNSWNDGYMLFSYTNTLYFGFTYDGVIAYITLPTLNQWYHAVGTFDITLGSNQVNIYLNIIKGTPATKATAISYTASRALRLGDAYVANDYNFNGKLGEVRIYNRALSAAEIQNRYLATKWRYQ